MKVFVYSKKTSKTIATIKDVKEVKVISKKHIIRFTTDSDEKVEFDMRDVKTSIYQNEK